MRVFCIFKENPDQTTEEIYASLEHIFMEYEDAKAYVKAHPPEIRDKLHIERWQAE
jgi:hypothetical protein